DAYAYPITYNDAPLIDKSQTVQFLKDRNASKKMLDCVDFVYEYAESKGIDPSIIMAISSIETGYGKSRLFVYNNNPGGIKAR
ncbi:glucosaminidase domain-containing protein, partial [Salmonella enterica]|uniref:glucosaminidase domain-containing protein n=1 Tax=Salmonella enterica TaxID=28901 RepID=UPI0020C28253